MVSDREARWHAELGKTFGVPFWNTSYAFTSSIKNDNKLKWMQYQIVRNCQFTNSRVHKFKLNVSPLCSYCGERTETISHLYFDCFKVQGFWFEICGWLKNLSINFPLNINYVLFGYEKEPFDSTINYIMLVAKRYIWTNKFKSTPLSVVAFLTILKQKLLEQNDMYDYEGKSELFDHWLPLLHVIP